MSLAPGQIAVDRAGRALADPSGRRGHRVRAITGAPDLKVDVDNYRSTSMTWA
jgi:hypothetical protein